MSANKNDVVIIELDRVRELRFGHKALKTYQALTGNELENLSLDGFSSEELEQFMYCGLLSDAKKNGEILEQDQMEDLLDMAPLYVIIEKMTEALNKAFGADDPNEIRTAVKK
ncbi:hypothetical protein PU629_06455 [Pullulanibacillus sp. KACC 23026]|uniref:hypothetical protein n=1 Tax=Pullulanibacillus sp. KACC 23026 TaxID=3028315 RepID=UPI0023AF0AD2|nr:hypothetical protein [Pullulanibacillus sp. KACC 23026]WEG14006.1 hypothetical protein PU629_06455 [Pullulanibacillus sp. KACC 23026]